MPVKYNKKEFPFWPAAFVCAGILTLLSVFMGAIVNSFFEVIVGVLFIIIGERLYKKYSDS